MSGRYVIVQMDNGEGVHLNLREVMAFGPKGDTQKRTEHYCRSLIKVKFSTDQVRHALGSGGCSIVD